MNHFLASHRLAAIIILALILPLPTSAMIIHHDRADEEHRLFAERYIDIHVELNVPGRDGKPSPGGNGLGTLIAPRWILTAAHVAQSFTPGHPANRSTAQHHVTHLGRNYLVASVHLHPDYIRRPSRASDIALVELTEPIVNHRYVDLYREQDEAGQVVIFVGSGHTGTGLTGPVGGDRMVRAATNRVASVDKHRLYFRFDPPGSADATELEGINGPGDSGSGALIERDDRLHIAGVSCCQDYDDIEGLYGVTEIFPRVAHYADWIDKVMQSQ